MKQGCDSALSACGGGPLERPRFFPRQLVTPAELTQAQEYFRQRLRLHNRLLWGWGTVCGTVVSRVPDADGSGRPDPWQVAIEPGYLLGPYGDDIVVSAKVVVDLRTGGRKGAAGEAPEMAASDPWCSRVCLPREPGPLYVAVRYQECMTRPVRVQPSGCGCESEACEYSRLRDGYEVGILDHCPPSHEGDPPDIEPGHGDIPACPECPDDPWVVLAKVEIGENGIEGEPDNCACRRLVVSLAPFWWRCGEGHAQGVAIREVTWTGADGAPARPEIARGQALTVTVTADGLPAGSQLGSSRLVKVGPSTLTGDKLAAKIEVPNAVPVGSHPLFVLGADGKTLAQRKSAFRVVAVAKPPGPNPPSPPSPGPVSPGGGGEVTPAPGGGGRVASPRTRRGGGGGRSGGQGAGEGAGGQEGGGDA